jgi:hypothetical protein
MGDCSGSDEWLKEFARLCTERDLLTQREGLEDGDLNNGLSDPHTLLYVPRQI